MCNTKPNSQKRTCIVCEANIYGRSDKVFCDTKCKNHYHSEIRKSEKTIASETTKVLKRNWEILTSLIGPSSDHLRMNKVELIRHGFNFNTVTGVEINGLQLKFSVYEFSWYFGKYDDVFIKLNKQQTAVSPFLFKRWKYRYSQDSKKPG